MVHFKMIDPGPMGGLVFLIADVNDDPGVIFHSGGLCIGDKVTSVYLIANKVDKNLYEDYKSGKESLLNLMKSGKVFTVVEAGPDGKMTKILGSYGSVDEVPMEYLPEDGMMYKWE